MTRWIAILTLTLLAGCTCAGNAPHHADADEMFAPVSMRIHPIFTQVKDWTSDGKPDGIEALIEFQDRFDDPTKAAGTVLFELYEYQRASADPRSPYRVTDPWKASIETIDQQKEHWSRTSGTYSFRLGYDAIRTDRDYVLTATFERPNMKRFFNQIIIEAQKRQEIKSAQPATLPGTTPAGRSPQP